MKKAISLAVTLFFVLNIFTIPAMASEQRINQILSDMEMENAVGGSGELRVEIIYPTVTYDSVTDDYGYYVKSDETCNVLMINSSPFDLYYEIQLINLSDDSSVIWPTTPSLTLLDNATSVIVEGDFSTELDVTEYTNDAVLCLQAIVYDGNGVDKSIVGMASRTITIEGSGE